MSLGSSGSDVSSTRFTLLTSACFRSRAPFPVSGQLSVDHPAEEPVVRSPLSCRLFGRRRSLLGRPISATGFRFPHGRPTTPRPRRGPDGVPTFHTRETRPGRVPPVPRERRCPHDRRSVLGRRLPILSGLLLVTPPPRPDTGSCRNEASAMVHWRSPFRSSPRLCHPARVGVLGLSPELRTRPLLATHARAGTGPGH